MPRRPGWLAYVHFREISCRCQRSNVSGVAIVAISRKAVTAHLVRPRSEPSAIVVGETQSPGPKLAPQELVLFDQVRNRLPLPAVEPAGQHAQHHLQRRGVDHETDLISRGGLKAVGREMEHYGLCGLIAADDVSAPHRFVNTPRFAIECTAHGHDQSFPPHDDIAAWLVPNGGALVQRRICHVR